MTVKPNQWWLVAIGLALLVAAVVIVSRPPAPPPLDDGTVYYTGPMVGKGQARPWTGSPARPSSTAPSAPAAAGTGAGGKGTPAPRSGAGSE